MKNKKVYQTTLPLHDINHLFDDPNISPFSDYYQPYSFKTGMDYVVDELYSHPSVEEIKLTVLLPAEQITPDLEAKTLKAVRKYSEAWAQNARQAGYRTIQRPAHAASGHPRFSCVEWARAVVRIVCEFWDQAVERGSAYWRVVLLWWPLDALAFGVRENRLEESAYKALKNVQLTIFLRLCYEAKQQRETQAPRCEPFDRCR
ncbi:MAG: hypothetical protein WCE82_11930 [Halobacteriota archaeon]